jgi:hypothetical protein
VKQSEVREYTLLKVMFCKNSSKRTCQEVMLEIMKRFLLLLTALGSLVLTVFNPLAFANPPEPKDQTLSNLSQLEKTWKAKKILSYSFKLERSCFCAPRVVAMTFRVQNEKSQISNLTKGQKASDWLMYSSIERLYAQMRILLKKGGRVALVTDANAMPTQIIFDQNIQATDDELYLSISSFRR